ncbi:MAG: cell division protein ZapA [Deltaproteobacteria bacterium]|nr:cell division protein ZapA [Deltaproteobacteria bacterium]
MDQFVTIEIFGHPFTFKADKNISKAKEVADYLVEEVARVECQLSDESMTISKRAILILAALNIANEYFEIKDNHANLLEIMERRASSLLNAINTTAP